MNWPSQHLAAATMLLVRCLYDLVCSFGLKAYSRGCWNSSKRVPWYQCLLACAAIVHIQCTLCHSCLSHSAQPARTCLYFEIRLKRSTIYVWKTFSWPLCKYIVSPTYHWWCSISFNSIHGIGMFHNPRTVTTEFCSFQQLRSGHDRVCMEGNSSSCGLSHGLGNSATVPQQEWGKSATKCTV